MAFSHNYLFSTSVVIHECFRPLHFYLFFFCRINEISKTYVKYFTFFRTLFFIYNIFLFFFFQRVAKIASCPSFDRRIVRTSTFKMPTTNQLLRQKKKKKVEDD